MKITSLLAHIDLNEIMRATSKPIRTPSDHIWIPTFNLQEMRMVPMPGTGTFNRFLYPEEAVINPTYRGVDNPNAVINPRQVFREMVVRNDDNITEVIPT